MTLVTFAVLATAALPFAAPGSPHAFQPATAHTRRELTLSLFCASELTLELHAVPEKYYATMENVQGGYDAERLSKGLDPVGSRDQGRHGDGTQSNPFCFDSDVAEDSTKG